MRSLARRMFGLCPALATCCVSGGSAPRSRHEVAFVPAGMRATHERRHTQDGGQPHNCWTSPPTKRQTMPACEGGTGWRAGWGGERAARVVRARGVGRRAVLTGGSCRTHRAQLVVERRDAVVHTVHRPELGRRRGHAGRRRAARHLREARGARRACCSLSRGSGGAGGGGGGRGGGRDDHGRLWGARAVRHDARASGGHVLCLQGAHGSSSTRGWSDATGCVGAMGWLSLWLPPAIRQ